MTGAFEAPDDAATPLTEAEKGGLIPSWVTYRHELNEVEQSNIARGSLWAFRQRRRELLDEAFILDLHKRLLGAVWRWAGAFRGTERNIGVEPWRIRPELRQLLDDARFWVGHGVYGPDELAVRFHHRLGGNPFPWGRGSLAAAGDVRARYIGALRAADRHEIAALLSFARS